MNILKHTDILRMSNGCLFVNDKPFVVEEDLDEHIWAVEDNQLVCLFRGAGSMRNYYNPEDIRGYWA